MTEPTLPPAPTLPAERREGPSRLLVLLPVAAALSLLLGWLVFEMRGSATAAAPKGTLTWHTKVKDALALAEGKLLHVRFTSEALPLSRSMDDTLESAPVAIVAGTHFINLRLDSRQHKELFRRWVGGSGSLASCVLDVRGGAQPPDVLAVLPGFADTERYRLFLNGVAESAGRMRALRADGHRSAESLLLLGELYAAQGSNLRARESFSSVLEPIEAKAGALERLARLDVQAGKTAAARRQLEQARSLAASPTPASAGRLALTEALILSSERRGSEAVALLEGLLAKLPLGSERDHAWLALGTLQHEQKRDAEALASFESVLRESRPSEYTRQAKEQIFHLKNPAPDHAH